MHLAPGLLVAAPVHGDPQFMGSVVLMVEHSEQGALGFIVNRVGRRSLRRVLDELGEEDAPIVRQVPVMVGGPMLADKSWLIFETASAPSAGEDVLMVTRSLGVCASLQFLLGAVREESPERFMLVQGYVSWSPGKLELELQHGLWIPVDLDARVLFDTPPVSRRGAALSALGIHPATLPRMQHARA